MAAAASPPTRTNRLRLLCVPHAAAGLAGAQVFKTLGDAGFLGVTKPAEYGGSGLDYTYAVAVAEELGRIRCGGVPMAIGVQTDMATPALAKFGSDALRCVAAG